MHSPVEQIKERLSIEEIVSSYIKLEKSGANLKARCPFHNEKTPSFFVSPNRGSYYCFGCGASGDIFTFVEEFEGLDFKGALKLLALKAGIELSGFDRKNAEEKDVLYEVMEEAAKFFVDNLHMNDRVKNYLVRRGLEDRTIIEFRLGYAKPQWRDLYFHLRKMNFSDLIIERAGLIKKAENNKSNNARDNYYDRFRGRIIFPISDSSGRVIAFSGRLFEEDLPTVSDPKSQAKYLNSPDTPIFNKSFVLYGLDKAKESIRKNDFSILVEGQMDLILSHQAGFRNTIASSGTALSDSTTSKEEVVSNLGLVRRLSGNMVLAFDGDRAGYKASERAGRIGLSLGMDVKIASLPAGMDPADLISKEGKEAWRAAIKNSKHVVDFMLGKALEEGGGDERKALRLVRERVLPYVGSLDSASEQSHFIKKISEALGVKEDALVSDLKSISEEALIAKKIDNEIIMKGNTLFRKEQIERKIAGIFFWLENQKEPHVPVDVLANEFEKIMGFKIDTFLQARRTEKDELSFEVEVYYGAFSSIEKEFAELLVNLKEEYLKETLSKKMQLLYQAEHQKDQNSSALILQECQIINNQLEEIKQSRNQANYY